MLIIYLTKQKSLIKLKNSFEKSYQEILKEFAQQRGLLGKGKEPQIIEAARVIIRDFSKGKIKYYEDPNLL